jgi:hypothetical protein
MTFKIVPTPSNASGGTSASPETSTPPTSPVIDTGSPFGH